MKGEYWDRVRKSRATRRRFVGAGAAFGAGAAGLALVGCGNDDDTATPGTTPGTDPGSTPEATPPDAAGGPRSGGIVEIVGGPIGSLLDIHRTNTPFESAGIWHRAGNFLMRLAAYPPDVGLPEPDLATAMPEQPDDLTLTFKLNTAAMFQDRAPVNGRQVVAEDVVKSFLRIMDPETTSPRAGNYGAVDSVVAIDDETVEFRLNEPDADLLSAMGDQYDLIIPHEIADRGVEAIQNAQDVIGSGPYELTAFEAGQRIQMTRRADGYWKPDTAWVDGWDWVNQVDTQARANALRTGQAVSTDLPADLVREFENDPTFYITEARNPTRECLLINHNLERYQDPRVRQAIWRAIDRQQVYDAAFGGAGIPGGPMTPAAEPWLLPEEELLSMPGFGDRDSELTEARALLDAAGVPDGFEDTILTVTAFSVDLVNDVIVSNLADIGIRLTTENIGTDFAVFLQREIAREYSLASTLFLSGPYPNAQLVIYHHTQRGSRNYGDYGSAELDAMLEQQSQTYDYEARLPLVQDIQRHIIDEPGPAWVGSRVGFGVHNQRYRGAVGTPFLSGYWAAEDAWLDD